MASLTDVIDKIPKVKKYEVFVVDLMAANFQTVTIAAKKNKQKFQNELSIALDALKLSSTLELHDWGGVISVAEDADCVALATGQDIGVDRLVFSFTPWSDDKIDESGNVEREGGKTKLPKMAQFAKEAGFRAMVVMTRKEGNCGKAETFNALRLWGPEKNVAYFEDTYDVLNLCAASLSQDSDAGTCVLHFVEPVDPNHQVVKNPDIAIVHESRQNYLERWQQHGDTPSVNSTEGETKQSNTSSKDLKLPRVHFKFPPPEFMNVNDQHCLADDTNSPKEWQKKKSAKEAKELAGSWCRELLQSAMDDDDKEQFQELLDGIGSGPPTNLNATWTVQSQELTLGGVLARRAGRTGKAWALSKLGNHSLGGTNSLIMFATDEKQTPLFYSFHNGNQQCCNVIVTIIEAEIERLKVLQKKASDEDNDEEEKRIKDQIKKIPDQQEILNQLRHERDHPVENVKTGNLFGDLGDGDY